MIRALIGTSLRLRVLVFALAVALLVCGVRTASDVPLDVFPEFAPPLVEIQTEAPGLSTEEVESLVTVPIESALNGVAWLETIRSKSVLGLSSVVLYFQDGTNLISARQLVQERLATNASRLPRVASPPVILPPLSSTSRVLKIGVSSDTLSRSALTELAKWTIRPRLMSIPGVANVAIWGERDRELQVLVNPERLRANERTLAEIETATRDAVAVGGGGFLDTPNQRIAIRHLPAVKDARGLAETVVAFQDGAPVRLKHVAKVTEGHAPPIGDAVINDGPGLLLIVEKEPWGNSLEVTRHIESALDALRPGLAGVDVDSTIFRPATFIERSIENLSHALLLSSALVVLILVLFLFDWRAALVSATALPLSLFAAVLVLYWRGGTVNTMVLAGLVIALGEVVDDAIIDVENIVRRLRQNATEKEPMSAFRVVLDASLEVRGAVVYASLIVILVFVPVFFLEGLAGAFFRPLASSYVLAILASLLVALTVTPALSLWLLPRSAAKRSEAPLVVVLRRVYRYVLRSVTPRPRLVITGVLIFTGFSLFALSRLGDSFLPNFRENDFLMHWVEKPGTSLEAMQRITVRASRELRDLPGVRNSFGAHIGRAEVADEVVGPNFTELWISIDPDADYDRTIASVQEVVDGYPGLYRDLLTYLRERIKEVLSGASATIVVRVFGPDLEDLHRQAQTIAGALAEIEGVIDLKVEPQVLVPQIDVRLNERGSALHGLRPADVRRAATTLVFGTQVGEIYEKQTIVRVVVRGDDELRSDPSSLKAILVDAPGGARVPLGEVADISIVGAPNIIKRERSSRRIDVTCNVRGRDLGSVASDIEARVSALPFDRGYHAEVLGEHAAASESRRRLLTLSLFSLLGVLVILYTDFRSIRLTLLAFLALPLALLGGVFGASAGGGVLSLGSLVGFVTILGIAARNGIMLFSHYRHLEQVEGVPFGPELVVRGADERLAPVLMTVLTTGFALLPLVYSGEVAGNEIELPMAQVILGGLVASSAVNLLVLPTLYGILGRNTAACSERE